MAIQKEKKELVIEFIRDQMAQADPKANAYAFDDFSKKRPTRNIYVKLNKFINDFIGGKTENRLVVLTGLRGSGKTTLMSQLYLEHKNAAINSLYLSVDQIVQLLGVTLNEFISVYEEFIGKRIEQLDKPLILFLDEVQYDEKWGITLKSIYDRSKKVFVFATGSSALHLNTNADLARRAIIEKLYPLSYSEYLKIKLGRYEIKGLSAQLRNILFTSSSAKDVYDRMLELNTTINEYLSGIDPFELDRYIQYGTLPFMIAVNNESLVYEHIERNIDRIINIDVACSANFTSEILSRIPAVLYAIADSDITVVSKLSDKLGISRPKLIEILGTLENTETLLRIYPNGGHYSQTNKPSKYLFSCPAFRSMYYNFIGSLKKRHDGMGKLLEDTVGMYLVRYLSRKPSSSITYDSSEGGADFIVSVGEENIILEVGRGEKGFEQINKTAKKVNAKYGLVISKDSLYFSEKDNAVRIPVEYFLLI